MSLSARTRWVGYGIAALATVAAMRWVDDAATQDTKVVAPAAPRPALRNAAAAQPAARATAGSRPVEASEVRLDWLARTPRGDVKADPFGPGPEDPAAQASLREPAPAPPPPPPQAPPLPFTYVGRWVEDGRTTVFLGRGGQHVAVRGAGRLDATYAVESIDEKQMVLKYLPLNQLQVLPLVPPAGAAPAAQVATAPPDSSENTEEETN